MSKIKDTLFAKAIKNWLKKEFPLYGDRFIVIDQFQIYNAKDNEVIWNEKQKIKYQRVEVFLELRRGSTEYVCDIRSDWSEIQSKQAVFAGLNNIKLEMESFVNNNKIST